ncbi:MobA/MobL family protein [Bradyrhizobium sp. HKCCYLR20261]|uniref:MobA/MobL family protein n=1 Tax=Bradyrhizobium sp. HKCCYLR20261 TaxID=3420760 RepID=UPI003EBB768B
MAITFARLRAILLTVCSGAVRVLAYTARTAIYDPRIDKVFDYTSLAADFACGGIILPEDHPPEFVDLDALAVNLDRAESRKIRTPLAERERLPQVGLALVVALPPHGELWLHEAAELMRRIVRRPPGSEAIAIHWAIHEAAINRHGHAYYALRSFDACGNAGPRIRDLMARHRSTILGTGIVEAVDWPSLVWETQQAFFEELGLNLVVDPIAPAPGTHLPPVVYANGAIHNERTRAQVARSREDAYAENLEVICGEPVRLVETLLRGRSSMRVSELERLCAKFVDHPADKLSVIERILTNRDIVALAEDGSVKPRYLTSRRVIDLIAEATEFIDSSSERRLATFTAADQNSLVPLIARHYDAERRSDRPVILGHAQAECEATGSALAAHAPIVGTVDMAVTGPDHLRAIGRERDLVIRPGRTIIVPHAERIDDQRLARLLKEVQKQGAEIILGHDQSSQLGIVDRGLAAYAADRTREHTESYGKDDVERLLRAGLIRLALDTMADHKVLRFDHDHSPKAHEAALVIACQDRPRVNELAHLIKAQRVQANGIEPAEELMTFRGTLSLSVGEWIVTTEPCETPHLEVGQFAQVVAIAPSKSAIEVAHQGDIKRINLERFAAIRSATTVTMREARALPKNIPLAVELTGRRHIWAALLLVARRHTHAQLHIDTALARSVEELADIAKRSLPAALPHQRVTMTDLNADTEHVSRHQPELEEFPAPEGDLSATVGSRFEPEAFPQAPFVHPAAPRPIHLEESVRSMIASDPVAYEGYRLLYDHVGPHNPNSRQNTERMLRLCYSELTAALIRHLAGCEAQPARDELSEFDLPPELSEHDPIRWTLQDVQLARLDLRSVTIPGSDWTLRAPRSEHGRFYRSPGS